MCVFKVVENMQQDPDSHLLCRWCVNYIPLCAVKETSSQLNVKLTSCFDMFWNVNFSQLEGKASPSFCNGFAVTTDSMCDDGFGGVFLKGTCILSLKSKPCFDQTAIASWHRNTRTCKMNCV